MCFATCFGHGEFPTLSPFGLGALLLDLALGIFGGAFLKLF
jgi:hypothetical protein